MNSWFGIVLSTLNLYQNKKALLLCNIAFLTVLLQVIFLGECFSIDTYKFLARTLLDVRMSVKLLISKGKENLPIFNN